MKQHHGTFVIFLPYVVPTLTVLSPTIFNIQNGLTHCTTKWPPVKKSKIPTISIKGSLTLAANSFKPLFNGF
ncbi:hypothetical protein [Paenibacillus polymyxa]|uniref:hypothetical protein n=1 Tax=Paenibacillus polymyxa TaxID=1406 RepID=UPI00157FC652|nr:hypothetical protein [Paenibacillus polymyxa]MBY7739970.1 hypothetical protein [Paenibacillus polymyxa]MDN4113393.1 hypothetical protein [Paenibacillus polymyxa]